MSDEFVPGADEDFTEKTHAENLEEKYEEGVEALIEKLTDLRASTSLVLSLLESTKLPCEKFSRNKVLNYYKQIEEHIKVMDELFVDGVEAEISSILKQYEELRAEKDADPIEPTGGHVGEKDFL